MSLSSYTDGGRRHAEKVDLRIGAGRRCGTGPERTRAVEGLLPCRAASDGLRELPHERMRAGEAPRSPRVVAFHGGKGGVGASILAAECAAVLGSRRFPVAAVDGDMERGCLHYYLDVGTGEGSYSITDLLPVSDELTPRVLENALGFAPCGARLLAAPARRSPVPVDPGFASRLVSSLSESFGIVLVDTPPSLDELTVRFLRVSQRVVFVVTPEVACLGTARGALRAILSSGVPDGSIELVVNRYISGGIPPGEIERYLGVPVTLVLPEDARRCRRLCDAGVPVTSERSRLAAGLRAMVERLLRPVLQP